MHPARYIVMNASGSGGPPLGPRLAGVPGLCVLRLDEPRAAVIEATPEAADELRRRHPDLEIEPDARHRPVRAG